MGEPPATELTHRLGTYELRVAADYGPRLLGLRRGDSPDLLVRLGPGTLLEAGRGRIFRFRGGHRLWVSPEMPEVSYAPDDAACQVEADRDGLRVTGPVDGAGFRKELEVQAAGDTLVVEHRLGWEGDDRASAAAWAITQLPLGGTAVMPLGARKGSSPLQADRSLILWPYTDLSDPRLSFRPGVVLVDARPGPRLKLGTGPAPRRLGYHRAGWLFIKELPTAGDGDYPDRGAVGQVFSGEEFCELESIGPVHEMTPGSTISHRETWLATPCPDTETAVAEVMGS